MTQSRDPIPFKVTKIESNRLCWFSSRLVLDRIVMKLFNFIDNIAPKSRYRRARLIYRTKEKLM